MKYSNFTLVLDLDPHFQGIISVISSYPPCNEGNGRFTTVPSKTLPDQALMRYQCFCFHKLFIFICRFSVKVNSVFLVYEKQPHRNPRVTVSSTILIRLRFYRYRCKLRIVIFAWRITWNYAYSPFKHCILVLCLSVKSITCPVGIF